MSVCFWGNFFIFALLVRLDKTCQTDAIVELAVPIHTLPSPESSSFLSGNRMYLTFIPQMNLITVME